MSILRWIKKLLAPAPKPKPRRYICVVCLREIPNGRVISAFGLGPGKYVHQGVCPDVQVKMVESVR